MKVIFFDQSIEKFIKTLDKPTIAKVLRTLDLLERFGNRLSMPYSKCIDTGLFEFRIRGKQHIRILYCFHKNIAVLLHAFVKKDQKIPKKEITIAKKRKSKLESI